MMLISIKILGQDCTHNIGWNWKIKVEWFPIYRFHQQQCWTSIFFKFLEGIFMFFVPFELLVYLQDINGSFVPLLRILYESIQSCHSSCQSLNILGWSWGFQIDYWFDLLRTCSYSPLSDHVTKELAFLHSKVAVRWV